MERPNDMAFEDYKQVRKNINSITKEYLKHGMVIHNDGTLNLGRNEMKRRKLKRRTRAEVLRYLSENENNTKVKQYIAAMTPEERKRMGLTDK